MGDFLNLWLQLRALVFAVSTGIVHAGIHAVAGVSFTEAAVGTATIGVGVFSYVGAFIDHYIWEAGMWSPRYGRRK